MTAQMAGDERDFPADDELFDPLKDAHERVQDAQRLLEDAYRLIPHKGLALRVNAAIRATEDALWWIEQVSR